MREPTLDDAAAIADLINEVTLAEAGIPWTTEKETRDELTAPDREAALPDALLIDAEGSIGGYLQIWKSDPAEVWFQAFVRPRLWGRGLSAWLLGRGEDLTVGRYGGPLSRLRVARFADNEAAGRLFGALGYTYVRTFWVMRIDLKDDLTQPSAVPGVRIRSFEPVTDEVAVHGALREAFEDHWGPPFDTFERWRHGHITGEGSRFDPGLWFVAVADDEVVGVACCIATTPRADDTGEVTNLGVRRPWRRRGIALALLQRAFAEMRRRGIAKCELGVDAENPTGATRLYERAGMHIVYSWEVWGKTLSPAGADAASPVGL
jgi:mycothiol synthase